VKKAALFVTAALLLALVAPVFAQPFADVPTDHWAYDAIAELAAKGLVEGYPDGTFKGDRALTRYEMAMIVARLLARIEAVAAQIPGPPPPPPAPEVRKADIDALRSSIDTINRLVREFQTDLQALGVRIESIEEELRNLRGQLDKTKVTGDFRLRYRARANKPVDINTRLRLTFTGQAAPNVVGVARAVASSDWPVPTNASVTLDRAYVDVIGVLGMLNFRLGRQAFDLTPVGALLYSADPADAIKLTTSLAGVSLTAYVERNKTSLDIWAGRAGFSLIPGWTFGLGGISERDIAAGTSASGLSFDFSGSLVEGLSLSGEWASFTPPAGTARSGYLAALTFDFNKLTGAETAFSPTLTLSYRNFDYQGNVPTQNAMVDYARGYLATVNDALVGDLRAWRAELGLQLAPALKFTAVYESGNRITTGDAVSTLDVYADWSVATNTTVRLQYARSTFPAGTDTVNWYRLQLTYSW
jgi:hypothetical protein